MLSKWFLVLCKWTKNIQYVHFITSIDYWKYKNSAIKWRYYNLNL